MVQTSWLLSVCRSSIGWKYTWGAAEKGNADCAGLFKYWYKQKGVKLAHGTNTMWRKYMSAAWEIHGDKSLVHAGDIVFRCDPWTENDRQNSWYGTAPGNVSHVGIYTGEGTVIEAKGTQYGCVETKWDKRWQLAGRFIQTVNDLYDTSGAAVTIRINKEADSMTYTVTAEGGVNLRTKPSTSSALLERIPQGTVLEAEPTDATWAKTTYKAKKGYVMQKYLTADSTDNPGTGHMDDAAGTVSITMPLETFLDLKRAVSEVNL